MQEIIQNADDARAREVKFFIDERSHGQQNLLHRSLTKFQGPALLAYNDAVFTDEDWKNIQKLKRSDKRSDPFKVGKFGIGFNSVFHVTGKYVRMYDYEFYYCKLMLMVCSLNHQHMEPI